jgi:threonine efflux protein
MANPKAAIYYASALSSATPPDAGFVLLSGMVLSVFVVATVWFTIVVSVLSTPKAAAAFKRFKVYFESFFGTLLVGFGVRQLISRVN